MMSEDERLREALEAELEDSYQEYLTLSMKGETQQQMQTSPEYERRMKELCRQMEKAETKQPEATEATGGSNIVMLQPTRKKTKRVYTIAKITGGLAAVAAVFLVILISSFSDSGLHSRGNEDALNIGYDNSSQPMEVGANDKTSQEQKIEGLASNAAEPQGTDGKRNPDVAAVVPADEQSPHVYECTIVAVLGSVTDGKTYLGIPKGVDIVNEIPSWEVENAASVNGDRNEVTDSGQTEAAEHMQLQCEIPKLDEVAFSELRSVKINGRGVAFTMISREDAETTTKVVLECNNVTGAKKAETQVKVYLRVSYGDEDVTWILRIAD